MAYQTDINQSGVHTLREVYYEVSGGNWPDELEPVVAPLWDIDLSALTNAEYFQLSATNNLQSVFVGGLNGEYMFVHTPGGTSTIERHTLATGWDVTSAVSSFPDSGQIIVTGTGEGRGLHCSPDGLNVYYVAYDTDLVYRREMTTAWDLDTAQPFTTFAVASYENNPADITLSYDGTWMYLSGFTDDNVDFFSLSTPWDITTATHEGAFAAGGSTNGPIGVAIDPAHEFLFTNEASTVSPFMRRIYKYPLNVPGDPTQGFGTATSSSTLGSIIFTGNTSENGMHISFEGEKIYWVNFTYERVVQVDTGYVP